jgi:transposase
VRDVSQVQDVGVLQQMVTLLQAENARLHKRMAELVRKIAQMQGQAESAQLEMELMKLQEQLLLMQRRLFGASSEKRPHAEPKPETSEKKPQRGHGPTPQPELPQISMLHELCEADRSCPLCRGVLDEMKGQTEEAQEITVVERKFVLVTHQRQKYRCRCNESIVTAKAPAKLIPGGRYSTEFAVEVAVAKYADHLPLERQARMMQRQGLSVSSQTLWDQLYALSAVLRPVYEALPSKILSAAVVHADETRWRLLEGRPAKTWQVWCQCSEFGAYYHLDPRRSTEVARKLFAGYQGVVMTDGFGAYQALARGSPELTLVFCWAHVRRKFVEAVQAYPQCEQSLVLIGALYEVERALPSHLSLDGAEREAALELRLAQRKKESAPILENLHDFARSQQGLPQSSLRKAIDYMLGLWPGLVRFVEDARIPLGRVEHWRGGCRNRGVAVSGCFRVLRRCLVPIHGSVSSARSSNRACGFPAPGSPPMPHAFAFGGLASVAGGL